MTAPCGKLDVMPVPIEFMRGVLGVIALGCVFLAGRAIVGVRRGSIKVSRLYGWVIRATLCLAALAYRHSVDTVEIAVWCLAVGAFAIGYWEAARVRKQEDLTDQIFHE